MIRFSKLLVGIALLSVAIVGFEGSQAHAASPVSASSRVSAPQIVQAPLRPVAQFGDWLQLGDLDCGEDIDFGATDVFSGEKVGKLLGSLLVNYVMCPTIGLMYNGIGLIINSVIGPMLKVDPLLQNGSPSASGKYLYSAWSVFRDFANIGLAFAVLLLIFSQATSYGLNAYGIKKLLPKIAIAALMINLSFIICALLIDVFNILGGSLGYLLDSAIQRAANGDNVTIADQIGLAASAISAIMVGATVASGGTAIPAIAAAAIIFVLLAFLVLLILGICCMFFAIARQILIAFMVVVAPIAIAAWLFPNTDRYFNRWWSSFIKILAIYPVVAVLQSMTLVFLLILSSLMV